MLNEIIETIKTTFWTPERRQAIYKAFIEALKEAFRLTLCYVASVVITKMIELLGADPNPTTTNLVLTAGLRSLDKWIHQIGKIQDNDVLKRGLTYF